MHKCRNLFTLSQYRTILENRDKTFALYLFDTQKNIEVIFKPQTKSMWHPKFIKNYTKKRSAKMIDRLEINKSKMFTITYDTKLYTALEVAKRHKEDIKKLIREIRIDMPYFQYSYFIELTKKNYVHFHLYTDNYFPVEDMSFLWFTITGSTVCFVKMIKSYAQKVYNGSYNSIMNKFDDNQLEFAWKNISRFFSTSRRFWKQKEDEEKFFDYIGTLRIADQKLVDIIQALRIDGTLFYAPSDLSFINDDKRLLIIPTEYEKHFNIMFTHTFTGNPDWKNQELNRNLKYRKPPDKFLPF